MSQQPTELNVVRDLYRFIDKKQPEVKWAAVMSFFYGELSCCIVITCQFYYI